MSDPFNYPGLRILSLFLTDPHREIHLREAAKIAGVSSSTAKRFLEFYAENGFVTKRRKANLVLFKGNLESNAFRFMKIGYLMHRIRPLIDYLKETYPNSSVTLYGSCARGEDGPDSDIDLLLVGRTNRENCLPRFEQKLGRRITLIVYTPQEWEMKASEDRAFYERVLVDGVTINGYLPVVAT